MGAGGATSTWGFRARAGVLTLMVAGSSIDRGRLLVLLAALLRGDVEPGVEIEPPSGMDVFWAMVEEDFLLEVADKSMLEPDGSVGPGTPMRTSAAGQELMLVEMALDGWLDARPEGELDLGAEARDLVLAVLIGGLATTALHWIALEPRSSAEVCEQVPEFEPEMVEGHLVDAERAGLLELCEWEDGEARYELTEWGRQAIVPIVAAARFEHRHPRGDTLAPDRLDVEMAFCFMLPLVELDASLEGHCQLAVRLPGPDRPTAGVVAEVRDGRVAVLDTELGGFEAGSDPDAGPPPGTLIGNAGTWMEEMVGGDPRGSALEGETELGRAIVSALRNQIFAAAPGS